MLGLAIRILDASHGHPLDILLVTAGRSPIARQTPMIQPGFVIGFYSTVLPYEIPGRRVLLGAQPLAKNRIVLSSLLDLREATDQKPLSFEMLIADLFGDWRPLGILTVQAKLNDELNEALCFNPVKNSIPNLRPFGRLQALRGPAYAASQLGRKAHCMPFPE